MSETPAVYDATKRFSDTNGLYANHYRFHLEALPDVSFFVTSVGVPTVSTAGVQRATPFTTIREVGDHLTYGGLTLTFKVDAAFKAYTSLYWWMKGYGFPHSYDEVIAFRAKREAETANPRPTIREMEKTNAVLSILQPDTESTLIEFRFMDVFPTTLGEMTFSPQQDAEELRVTATFDYTDFDLYLV